MEESDAKDRVYRLVHARVAALLHYYAQREDLAAIDLKEIVKEATQDVTRGLKAAVEMKKCQESFEKGVPIPERGD